MTPTIAAARDMLSRGFQPLPIPPVDGKPSKGPRVKGWQRFRCELGEVPEHFRDGDNLGLLLGAPSHGLVDVDLDCPEAIRLAPELLPETGMIHGREGAPRSHWWYVSDPRLKVSKVTDPAGGVLVELRATGGQTVIPPSVHPGTGLPYRWDSRELDPARVEGPELEAAVRQLGAASWLVRQGWPDAAAIAAVKSGRGLPAEAVAMLTGRRQAPPNPKPDLIGQVLARVDVARALALLGVGLAGRRGPCPIRDHETARDSFVVDGDRWTCHACPEAPGQQAAGGDAVELVARVQGVGNLQAARWLAEQVGLDVPGPRAPAGEYVSPRAASSATPPKPAEGRKPVIVFSTLDELDEDVTEWLWYPYLPRGELVVLAGQPGTGKSNLARWLAAMVSRGADLEGLTSSRESWLAPPEPGRVQFVCGEDHPTKVVRPRLRIQGADLGMIQIAEHPEGRPLTTLHLDGFRAQWDEAGPPALLILDPASSMVPGGVDTNAQAEVKASVTGPLLSLAQDYGVCVLLVAHVAKGALSGGAHPSSWVLGSTEWVAGPRASLVALRSQHDLDDPLVRVFHAKSNLGPHGPAFAYEVASSGRHCRVEWRGLTLDSPASLTAKPKAQTRPSTEQASTWLREFLEGGDPQGRSPGEVFEAARAEGLTQYAVRAAADLLGVEKVGQGRRWLWTLPPA